MMSCPVKLFINTISCLLLLLCSFPTFSEERDPELWFFNQYSTDFRQQLDLARDEGKSAVVILFEMENCVFCERLKTTVLNQPAVQKYYRNHFRVFPVDVQADTAMMDFAGKDTTQKAFSVKKHRVRATPVIAFFDLEGSLLHRHAGTVRDADEFMLMGAFVADEHYKTMRFSTYQRDHNKLRKTPVIPASGGS